MTYLQMSKGQLNELKVDLEQQYDSIINEHLSLDLSRGKTR